MSDRERLARLTNLLYGLAAVMFGGTVLELLAARHYQDPVQFIPFVLCGAGFVAVLLAWKRPGWATVLALRSLMLVTAAATLLGIWKHIEGNIGFIRKMHPATSGWPLLAGGADRPRAAARLRCTRGGGHHRHCRYLRGRLERARPGDRRHVRRLERAFDAKHVLKTRNGVSITSGKKHLPKPASLTAKPDMEGTGSGNEHALKRDSSRTRVRTMFICR